MSRRVELGYLWFQLNVLSVSLGKVVDFTFGKIGVVVLFFNEFFDLVKKKVFLSHFLCFLVIFLNNIIVAVGVVNCR